MSLFALGLILISAVFHATWNLLAKRAGADTPFLWLAYLVGAIVFAPFAIGILVIARPELGWAALIFIAVAVGLQTLYFATLTAGYRAGDLSLVYPIARASGPLLAMIGAIAIFAERPTPVAIGGALAIVAGAFFLTGDSRAL
jgi:drug/metabolite transporter (DMT)-like permease